MINSKQRGDDLTLIAPAGGVVAGTAYQIGQIIVVAKITAAAGVEFTGATMGIFNLAKLSAQAWTVGQLVYFDATNLWMTTVASGNQRAGVAMQIAANPTLVADVRLNGTFHADEP